MALSAFGSMSPKGIFNISRNLVSISPASVVNIGHARSNQNQTVSDKAAKSNGNGLLPERYRAYSRRSGIMVYLNDDLIGYLHWIGEN